MAKSKAFRALYDAVRASSTRGQLATVVLRARDELSAFPNLLDLVESSAVDRLVELGVPCRPKADEGRLEFIHRCNDRLLEKTFGTQQRLMNARYTWAELL